MTLRAARVSGGGAAGPGAGGAAGFCVVMSIGFSGLRSRRAAGRLGRSRPEPSGLLWAVHRTVRPGPDRARAAHSGQLRLETVSRTLVMISCGIGA
ncbi:hypothetical protein GCM10009536_43830 [Streptomyces thermocarboxydus]